MIDAKTKSKNLKGKTFIVTGANSGIGLETTKQLITQGANVVMGCRNVSLGKEKAHIFKGLKGSFEVLQLDLAQLQSVRNFVKAVTSKYKVIDGLACNAGFINMNNKVEHTVDNLETTIAVSYFGHFLLTELLLDTLKKSKDARVVLLSSVIHAGSPKKRHRVHLKDINYIKRPFNNFDAYCEAKVACNLYAIELANRMKKTSITTYSVHPGWARSNFGKGGNIVMKTILSILKPIANITQMSDSCEDSAQTTLHCLLSDDAPKYSGQYFSQSSVLYRDKECRKGGWPMKSPNPFSRDTTIAKELVELSYTLVGLKKGTLKDTSSKKVNTKSTSTPKKTTKQTTAKTTKSKETKKGKNTKK